jgi:hypothetical protein
LCRPGLPRKLTLNRRPEAEMPDARPAASDETPSGSLVSGTPQPPREGGRQEMSRGWIRHFHGRAGARKLRLFATVGAGACLLTAGTAAWMPGVARGQASSLTFTGRVPPGGRPAISAPSNCITGAEPPPLPPGMAAAEAACRSGPGFGRSGTMERGPSMYEMEGPRPASRRRPADFSASLRRSTTYQGQERSQRSGRPDRRVARGLPAPTAQAFLFANKPGVSPKPGSSEYFLSRWLRAFFSPNDQGFP